MFRSFVREFNKSIVTNRGFLYKARTRLHSNTASRRLEGKVALITGGASGLGKATAQKFIENGAQVIIADINTQLGPQVAEELGPSAHFAACDVTDEAQVGEAVEAAVARHGKLDVMYNNVGITGPVVPGGISELELGSFDEVMRVNVRGTVAGIKQAARVMVPAGSGSILCTGSISGLMGGLGPHPYTISKFTIVGLVRSFAADLCQSGVRINCISPGPIPTALAVGELAKIYQAASLDQITQMLYGLSQLKGAKCEEIDVANAALFLASDEAKFITGHNLVLDGGFTSFKTLNLPNP